jgi:NitT/TauT family transport system substrate-binding protein
VLKRLSMSLASAAAIALMSTAACADKANLTVSTQPGVGFLPMSVMKHNRLIEKHAADLGLGVISVKFVTLGGGTAANDALLSGSVDLGASGTTTIIQLWSASAGGSTAVKAIGALGSQPLLLNTTNANVKTISDFTEQDRIAVPAAKVGVQATLLQMECARLFGEANYAKLDHLTITMPHYDALPALLSGSRGSITAHFGQSPFQDEELKNPKVHTVLTSHDVLGGSASGGLLATTALFRDANPVLFKAVFAALEETIRIINADKRKAAQIYVEEAQAKDAPEVIERIISAPQVEFSVVPNGIKKYADFMYKIGRIKRRPEKWSDMFFDEIQDRAGS